MSFARTFLPAQNALDQARVDVQRAFGDFAVQVGRGRLACFALSQPIGVDDERPVLAVAFYEALEIQRPARIAGRNAHHIPVVRHFALRVRVQAQGAPAQLLDGVCWW